MVQEAEALGKTLRRVAPRFFRRDLSNDELAATMAVVKADMEAGRCVSEIVVDQVRNLLTSPDFFCIVEEPGPLSDFALTSRLSYFLWNSAPDEQLLDLARKKKLHESVVLALMGLKGYQTIAAMITVSEIGDIHNFPHPRQLMAYLGLVPSESSSGGSRAQGSITKCGNGHLRWIFNECAQHYRLPPKVRSQLTTRQEAIPKAQWWQVMEISWRAQNRLHENGPMLAARGKTRQKVQTALAR